MAMGYDGSIKINTNVDQKGFTTGRKQIENGLSGMTKSLKSFGAAVGIAFSVTAIINFGKSAVQASTELKNAMTGLQSIMEGQGRSFSQAQAFIDEYVSDGLIPATDAITAYKNLASRKYTDTQIQQTLIALKDSAAYGRQASYSLGEAVKGATEGLKNENSILVDNAGVTKNVAKMWDDYARSIGTTANNLTQQQKVMAEVNGILEETKYQTGDAAKVADSFSGQILRLQYNFNKLKVALGDAIIPIAQAVLPAINAMIEGFTQLANVFASVSQAIFGKAAVTQQAVADTATDAATSENELADATTAAAKAAKAAVQGFDELNIKQGETAAAAGLAGVAGAIDNLTFADPLDGELGANFKLSPNVEKVIEKLKSYLNPEIWVDPSIKMDTQKTVDEFKDAWNNIKRAAEKLFGPINFDVEALLDATVKIAWNVPPIVFNSALTWFSGQMNIFSGMVLGEFDTTWEGIGQAIEGIIKGPAGIANVINDAFKGHDLEEAVAGQILFAFNPLMAAPVISDLFLKLLFGEKYEQELDKINDFFSPLGGRLKNIFEGVSSTTANALQPVLDGFEQLDNTIKDIAWGDKIIEETDTIRSQLASLSSSILDSAIASKQKALEDIDKMLKTGVIDENDAEAMKFKIEMAYKHNEAVVMSSNARIMEIMNAAKEDKKKLTEEEQAEITKLLEKMKSESITILSGTKDEEKTIRENMANNSEAITTKQAADIIRNANKTRDDSISAAKKARDETIASIREQRDKNIITSDEQANRMIANATRTYRDAVDNANKMRIGVVEEAKKQAGEHAAYIEEESGNIKSDFERAWTDVGLVAKGVWEGIKMAIWDAVPDWLKFVLDKLFGIKFPQSPATTTTTAAKTTVSSPSSIPKFATGAVIPPNAEFAAILGDQRNGRNLEAPEALIRKIVREESGGGDGNISLTVNGDMAALFEYLTVKITRQQNKNAKAAGNTILEV